MIRIARVILVSLLATASLVASAGGPPSFGPPRFGDADQQQTGDSRDVVKVSTVASSDHVAPGGQFVVAVILEHNPGWHSWANAGNHLSNTEAFDGAINTALKIAGSTSQALLPHLDFIQWPTAHANKADVGEGVKDYTVFTDRAVAYIPVSVKSDAKPGPANIDLLLTFQSCNEHVCMNPAFDVPLTVSVQIGDLSTPPVNSSSANADVFQGFDSSIWGKMGSGKSPQIVSFDLFGIVSFKLDVDGGLGLLLLLLMAALGGFLLNFTPCVLPMIPLKIMSLSHSAKNRRRALFLGIVMNIGVVGFWVALGLLISVFKVITATNELFQYPAFTIGVGLFIAIMGVGMCGFFSVRLPQAVYMINPTHETVGGSFMYGIMTAVLSTPCTAPFMGVAAAWAANQTTSVTLTTFASIGLGMALPYLILAAFPNLVSRMPRTGPASELIKQVMGFLMLAAAAYFVGVGISGVLVHPPEPPSLMYLWFVALFVAAAGGWMLVRTLAIAKKTANRVIFGGLGALMVLLAIMGGRALTDRGPIKWVYYTPDRLAQAQQSGKVVVMEFTAEWCLNCKALEKTVLHHPTISKLFAEDNVTPIKVDLTGNNDQGNQMLHSVQRLTIPLLVVFAPDGSETFKGDFYTVDQVVTAVREAQGKNVAKRP